MLCWCPAQKKHCRHQNESLCCPEDTQYSANWDQPGQIWWWQACPGWFSLCSPCDLGLFFPQLVALLPPVFPKGVADQRRPYNWPPPRHAGRPLHQQQQQRHARLPGAAQLWQSVQQPQVRREHRWKAKGTIGSQSNTAHVAFSLHWTILLAITQVFLSFQKLSAAANIFLAGWRSFEWRRSKLALRCKFLQIVRIKWWCNEHHKQCNRKRPFRHWV